MRAARSWKYNDNGWTDCEDQSEHRTGSGDVLDCLIGRNINLIFGLRVHGQLREKGNSWNFKLFSSKIRTFSAPIILE